MEDAFQLLRAQHLEIEERLEALGGEEGEELGPQAAELFDLLRLHMRLEELFIYELVERFEGRRRASRQLEDHRAAQELMAELEELPAGAREWRDGLAALEDIVVAHFEEERRELYPRLRGGMDRGERSALSRRLAREVERLSADAARPPPQPRGLFLQWTSWGA